MEMQVEYESGLAVTVPAAYIRVEDYSGNKDHTTVYVNTYSSQESCEEGKAPVKPTVIYSFPHVTDDGAPNIVKQGYEYIKTLPEYAGAIDC
jgi:hypothetical protein